MLTRIISGLVCTIIGVAIMFVNNPIVDNVFIFLVSVIGLYEFYKAFNNIDKKPVVWIGYIFCIPLVFLNKDIINKENIMTIVGLLIPTIIIISFAYIVLTNLKRNIIDIAITFIGILYIPFLFSFLKQIMFLDNGRILLWYVLFGAWIGDVFAYFIGKKFGKHKLCPKLSPGKTIEGSIAGVISVVIVFVIYTLCINKFFNMNLPLWYMIIVGIISSIIGQFGDLFASITKRHCNIKDYGSIIPGHGGILDRFDSILFVAPVVYVLLQIIL